jgi:hypothetical protein
MDTMLEERIIQPAHPNLSLLPDADPVPSPLVVVPFAAAVVVPFAAAVVVGNVRLSVLHGAAAVGAAWGQ